jgi:hypothetical protein
VVVLLPINGVVPNAQNKKHGIYMYLQYIWMIVSDDFSSFTLAHEPLDVGTVFFPWTICVRVL